MIWNILASQELTIPLPVRLTRETMYAFLEKVLDENGDVRCKIINIDFSSLQFIDSAGMTVLSNLISYVRKCGAKAYPKGHKAITDPIAYLDDAGFFREYFNFNISTGAAARRGTLSLQLVAYARSYEYMEYRLVPWLARALNTNDRSLSTVKVCFQEIFNNINDHSEVNVGCICAQHYPTRDVIQVTVSDFGIGIPTQVRKLHPLMNDQQLIAKASEQGFTTQTTVRNRGAGLDVLIKNVVAKNGGAVMIHSRRGILTCARDPSGVVKRTPRPAAGLYPGTMIQLALHTDTFVSDDPDEEFEW